MLVTMHDVDQLGYLLHDLLEALWSSLETDRHTAEVGITALRYD